MIYDLLTYLFLALAIISLWVNRTPFVWGSLLGIAMALGWIAGRLSWIAIVFILFYGALVYATYHITDKNLKRSLGILTAIVSYIWISPLHIIPGFSNWLVAKALLLSPKAFPFSLYLNFDKPLVGLFILAFGGLPLLKHATAWQMVLWRFQISSLF